MFTSPLDSCFVKLLCFSDVKFLYSERTIIGESSICQYSIPTDIFKMTGNIMESPLTEIINLSFSTGIYPNNLKIAKIIPVFKNKGSNLQCNNYRPISLLSNINKIFEKLMYTRLYNF